MEEEHTCPSCGAIYTCRFVQRSFGGKESDRFTCDLCGEVVKSWRAHGDYVCRLVSAVARQSVSGSTGSPAAKTSSRPDPSVEDEA